jgi:hypothetical protein
MADNFYPYDRELYSRWFLDCYQRQSMVMLAESHPQVGRLLHRCLISTDEIVEQVVRRQIPKYDFASRLFDAEDLLSIGLVRQDIPVESYAEARDRILEAVATYGYVIIMIDVFYLEHCPEFRRQHVVHSITLKEYDPRAGEWSLIDDNPASVLCRYRYPEEIIAASFDNNTRRRVRYYSTVDFDERAPAAHASAAFSERLSSFQDSHRLFSEIVDLISCPWLAPEKVIALLHDAFSLHMGSRICLLEYVKNAIGDAGAANTIRAIVRQDAEVQNMLLLGKVTGSVDADWMKSICAELRTAEEQLLRELRAAVAVP